MSLVDLIAGPDGDLLGLCRVLRDEALGSPSMKAARRLPHRFRQVDYLRHMLELRKSEGYRGVVAMGGARLFEILGKHHNPLLPRPVPVIPNLQGFMREAVEYGMVGAGLRRAWRVGPVALAGLGIRGVGRMPQLAKRDFPTMLRCFVELELADFKRFDPPVVFLQPQMTDLAVAMHNPRILEAFADAVRDRTGAVPALYTFNFVSVVSALKTWGIETAAFLTPWDNGGLQMRPNLQACQTAAKALGLPIWAERQGHLEPPSAEERAAWDRIGLAGAVRDDLSLWLPKS